MIFKGAISFSTLFLVLVAFDHTKAQNKISPSNKVSKGIEEFAFELLLRSALKTPTKNVVVSPFSVWAMMTVLSEGAAGVTEKELKYALRHPSVSEGGTGTLRENFKAFVQAFDVRTPTIELESTNYIFMDRRNSISPNYKNVITSIYRTNIEMIDFTNSDASAEEINFKVRQATRGRTPQIVEKADLLNTQMLLINAIYFRGQWTTPFNASLTTLEPFYNDNGQQIGQVNMMYQRAPYPYFNSKAFNSHIIEIPYGKENRLSMVIMIPKNGVRLEEVFQKFTTVPVSEIFKALSAAADEFQDDEVDFYLPRFSVSYAMNLNAILNEMGIYEPFDPVFANFSKLTTSDNLYLSRVIHKAQIEVTEEGTVASAITAGELSNRNTPPKVVANKPFFYIIVEKNTNVVVFGGTYVAPQIF